MQSRKPRGGCFIYGNLEHRARDCPKRGKLNAMVAEQTDGDSETEQTRVGALQLSVLQAESRAFVESRYKGLMMVAGQINVSGVASTELRVGSWSGQCDFMAVRLDDFDVILGIDFFITTNVMILPRLGGIFISGGNKPAFVRGEYEGELQQERNQRWLRQGRRMLVHRRKGHIVLILPVLLQWEDAGGDEQKMDQGTTAGTGAEYFGEEGRQNSCVDEGVDISWWGWFCHGTGPVDGTWHDVPKVQERSGDNADGVGRSRKMCGVCRPMRTALGQGMQKDAGLCTQHSAVCTDRAGDCGCVRTTLGRCPQMVRTASAGWPIVCARMRTALATWPIACGQPRQAGRYRADGLSIPTDRMRTDAGRPRPVGRRLARNTPDGNPRQTADGSGQGLVIGYVGNKHGACAGHVMRRLRADNRPSIWQRWLCKTIPWWLAAVRVGFP
ncbi:UNVERIFIED_CONTAM: hypothetical protein Slati_3929100 [Sesamum latifolium]|uniref:Uncharacterized protein n=1 Tax=Sesamum latifolium TaxID=2727402 RepID=A0AAW2TNH3_9LAMI